MKISTNLPGLRAMNSASQAEKRMEQISKKLSTGLKISSARDDTTGNAISTKLRMQSDGTKIANQNTMNAISVLDTAEAGLSEINSILQRMRELSVEAANETLTSADRLKIQSEVEQMKEEIDAISDRTDYNKINLLNGHAGLKAKSADAKVLSVSENIKPGTYEITVNTPATTATTAFTFNGAAFPDASLAGTITVNGIDVEITVEDTQETAYAKFQEAAEAAAIDIDLDASGNPVSLTAAYYGISHGITITSDNTALLSAFGFGSGVSVYGTDADIASVTGFSADARVTVDGNRVTVSDTNNRRMAVELDPGSAANPVEITVTDNRLVFQTGANMDINVEVSIGEVSAASLGIDRLSVATVDGAQQAISQLDLAISQCSAVRIKVGAYQNQLELVNSSLENSDVTLQTTLSKVADTDMAYELAELSRYKIMSQGALSIMVQANQRPQSVLQLIQ